MKVDKAVCTNETMEDLYRAIRYETVFTALVENKILAIKRECDERQRLKKTRAHSFKLGGLLSSKQICCIKHDSLTHTDFVPNQPNTKISNTNDVGVDSSIDKRDTIGDSPLQQRTSSSCDIYKSPVDDSINCTQGNYVEDIHDDKIQVHESESICSDKSKKITFQSGLIDDKHKTYKGHSFRRKPSIDSNFSQNSSTVLESYVSEDGHGKSRSRVISTETICSNQNKFSLHETTAMLDHERRRLRILEARSISAQCSPVFQRPFRNQNITTQVPYTPDDNQLVPLRLFTPQTGIDATKDNVILTIANSSVAIDTAKEKEQFGTSFVSNSSHNSNELDIIRLDKTKFAGQFDTKPGFINSFNQLTSQNQTTLPVITTIKSKKDAIKLHHLMNSSIDTMTKCSSKSRKKDGKYGKKMPKGQLNVNSGVLDCNNRSKRKHKRAHRCSDPLLIYPSSNGFQHCILSMPPNQPLQLHYDENNVFDVSLQMDGNRNRDLDVIMPGHRKHRHRHHHHHHHRGKNVGKRKILVHDLDNQSVKVIDPDDLPQRARWTIIATACLLLIMCLLLVGVTLRMAPFIDDMAMDSNITAKCRPPRLSTIDRTISMSIENYVPPTSASTSKIMVRSSHNIADQLAHNVEPPIVMQKDFNRYKLYQMNRSHNSVLSEEPPCFSRKPTLKRSDTVNIHADMMDIKKTHSFQSSIDVQPKIAIISDIVPASKRAASFRLLPVYVEDVNLEKKSPTSSIRRSCKMHRSFNDQTRKTDQRKEVVIETIKCHSLGDEDTNFPEVRRKLSPKFSSGISMEDDIYPSNGRNQPVDKVSGNDVDQSVTRKLSSQSLDKQYKFQRGAKYSNSFYLSPNSPEILTDNIQFREKRQHSASMRARPHREMYSLGVTKKSKSFINKPEFERSPQSLQRRRESVKIFSAENGKKSPNLIIPDSVHSVDSRSNLSVSGALDYDSIIRAYQQNRRKSSVLPVEKKTKNVLERSRSAEENDDLHWKRRKIMCIIFSVFFSLLFASVFVVIFTLTHSEDTVVQNQTKKVYTFSRDVPIHHNVRQENERLMQESLNRAKFARNFTETAPLAASEEIP